MNYYLTVLKIYAVFSGRATRAEYWYFTLINFVISLILNIFDKALHLNSIGNLGVLSLIYSLAVLIPGLAVTVRRLLDIIKCAWMLLILFIPFIGAIWLLILMLLDSKSEGNKYGVDSKNDNESN